MSESLTIAQNSGMLDGGFAPALVTGAGAVVGAVVYCLKALADSVSKPHKNPCTKNICKIAEHKNALVRQGFLAGIVVLIIVGGIWGYNIHVSSEERIKIAMEARTQAKILEAERLKIEEEALKRMRAAVTQQLRKNGSIESHIRTLALVEAFLITLEQTLRKANQIPEPEQDCRAMLEATVNGILDEFNHDIQRCHITEEVLQHVEGSNMSVALVKMKNSLVLTLLPDYEDREDAKMFLHPGDTVPRPPVLDKTEIWERRDRAISLIKSSYLPDIRSLRESFEKKRTSPINADLELR